MKINQVLVVYKQLSPSELKKKPTRGQELHLRTLDTLYPLLREYGVSFQTCSTKQLKPIKKADIVITVGGDGTALRTSHFVDKQPILGIKSYGRESIGYFCAATTDTLRLYLESLFEGHHKPIKLQRLEVSIDGYKIRERALNDILFAHASPAATSKYRITVNKKSEVQRSSGIWVSSAAGSTAAVSTAGGKPLPLESKQIEFVVREPYAPATHYKILKEVLPSTASIKIESMIKHGIVYVDGSHIQYPAGDGSKIIIKASKKPLNIFWKK